MKAIQSIFVLALAVLVSRLAAELYSSVSWDSSEAMLIVTLSVLCFLPIVLALHRRQFDVFDPIYVLSGEFFVIYVLGSLAFVLQDLVQREDIYRSELAPALVLALVGLVGGYLGYAWGRHQFDHRRNAMVNRLFSRVYDPKRVFTTAVVALLIAVTFYLMWIVKSGRSFEFINVVFSDTEQYTSMDGSSGTLYFFMFRNSWHVLILLAWVFAPNQHWKRWIGLLWILNIAIAFLRGGRQNIFFAAGSLLILWYLVRQKRPSLTSILIVLIIGVWAASYAVSMRGASEKDPNIPIDMIVNEAIEEISYRSALYGSMIAIRVFPDRVPYVGFSMFRDLFIAWIPRTLWPDKPVVGSVGMELLEYMYGGKFVAIVIGMVGHYYVGFGTIGVFFAFAGVGALNAFIYEIWLSKPEGRFRSVFLSLWLIFFFVIIQRGNPDFFIVNFIYYIGPLFVVWLLSSRPNARPVAPLNPSMECEEPTI